MPIIYIQRMTLEVVGMQKMLLNDKHNAGRHPTAAIVVPSLVI